MGESKPPIPPRKFCSRSASERTSVGIDPRSAESANSDELVAVKRQSSPGQIEACRNDFLDGSDHARGIVRWSCR